MPTFSITPEGVRYFDEVLLRQIDTGIKAGRISTRATENHSILSLLRDWGPMELYFDDPSMNLALDRLERQGYVEKMTSTFRDPIDEFIVQDPPEGRRYGTGS